MGEFHAFYFLFIFGVGMREIFWLTVIEESLGTGRSIRCVWCVVGFWDGVIDGGVL